MELQEVDVFQSKTGFLLLVLMFGFNNVHASSDADAWNIFADMELRAKLCAGSENEKANIANITKKINLFGTWKGVMDGDQVVATLFTDANGKFKGKATKGSSSYGPFNLKICDEDGLFYGVILGYNAKFEILSKTQVKVYSPTNQSVTAILTKQK